MGDNLEYDEQAILSSAHELWSLLPKHMHEIFHKNLEVIYAPLVEELGEWMSNSTLIHSDEISLEVLVLYMIDYVIESVSTEQASLELYKRQKRNKKDYLYKCVQKELDNPCSKKNSYILAEWELLNLPQMKGQLEKEPARTEEEFCKSRLAEIEEWYRDPSSYLCDFKYFNVLSPKRKMKCFLDDLGVYIYTIICTEFYRNKLGFLTKSPDVTFGMDDGAIINWQSSAMDLQYEALPDKIIVYELIGNSNSMNQRRLIIDEVSCDCSSPERQKEAIAKLDQEYKTGVRLRTLDPLDFNIILAILNNMTLETATSEPLILPFKSLCNDVYGKERFDKRKKRELLYRMFKLARIKISSNVQDAQTGKYVGGDIISFFDLTYDIRTVASGNNPVLTTIGLTEHAFPDVSKFSIEDIDSMIFTLVPSLFMKEQWQSGLHSYVSSHMYKQITTQKGKFLLQILQGERIRIYPAVNVKLPLDYFRKKFRFPAGNNGRVKREIVAEIEQLKALHAIVEDYQVLRASIEITFVPLSDFEKIKYKIETPESLARAAAERHISYSDDDLVIMDVEQQTLHFE